jgi:hypothetical protein
MHRLRLTCSAFHVDVRLTKVGDVWLASADTPDAAAAGGSAAGAAGADDGVTVK